MYWIIPVVVAGGSVAYEIWKRRSQEKKQQETRDARAAREHLRARHGRLPNILADYLPKWLASIYPPPPAAVSNREVDDTPESHRRPLITPTSVTLLTLAALVGIAIGNARITTLEVSSFYVDLAMGSLLGALIGIGTNWLAIKMLFRPITPILGIQGVIPGQRHRLIEELSQGIARNLLDADAIRQAVHDSNMVRSGIDELMEGLRTLLESSEFKGDLQDIARAYVTHYFQNAEFREKLTERLRELGSSLPKTLRVLLAEPIGRYAVRLVNNNKNEILQLLEEELKSYIDERFDVLVERLKSVPGTIEERRAQFEGVISEVVAERMSKVDIASIVKSKLDSFDEAKLEDFILSATDKHLAKVQYFGGFIGLLLGAVPVFVR